MAAARNVLNGRAVRVAARLALIVLLAAGLGALTLIAAPAPSLTFGADLVMPVGEEARGNDSGKD